MFKTVYILETLYINFRISIIKKHIISKVVERLLRVVNMFVY